VWLRCYTARKKQQIIGVPVAPIFSLVAFVVAKSLRKFHYIDVLKDWQPGYSAIGALTEIMPESMSLEEYLKLSPRGLSRKEVHSIAQQVASGLNSMHKDRILHLDIKPGNIMFDSDLLKAKIIDLGLSLIESDDYRPSQAFGTPGFMAPELLKYNFSEEYSKKADAWSFGALLYVLAFGMENFKKIHEGILGSKKVNVIIPLESSNLLHKDREFILLLSKLLCPKEERATCEEILEDEFLTQSF